MASIRSLRLGAYRLACPRNIPGLASKSRVITCKFDSFSKNPKISVLPIKLLSGGQSPRCTPTCPPFPSMKARCLSTNAAKTEEIIIYSSKFENILQVVGIGSVIQAGLCGLAAGLVTLHPAAAQSALMPDWTFQGRATLGGALLGFGAFVAVGCRGFLSKNIVRVATLPSDADHIHVYTFKFPSGSTCHRVPRKEFYAITAAYEGLDLGKETRGPAPVVPVFVGGAVMGTLLIDLRGGLLDEACMHQLLSGAAAEIGSKDWQEGAQEDQGGAAKKPFIPNRHRSKLG